MAGTDADAINDPRFQAALAKYPGLAGFMSMPGIAPLLLLGSEAGWNAGEMEQHFEQTAYWKNTSGAARQWDVLKATDPATAQQRWDTGFAHMNELRSKLGVNITEAQFQWIGATALHEGWTDDTLTSALLGVHAGGRMAAGGDYGAALTQIRSLASDYGVTTGARTQLDQATALLTGGADAAGTAEYYKQLALNQYGHNTALVGALNRGVTVKQYADPYLQMAANEVGANPADMNLTSPKWNAFLTQTDPKTGASMSLAQWQSQLRNDPRYGYNRTAGAADQAAQLTSALAKEFGAAG